MTQKILIIGGSGKRAARVFHPVILGPTANNVKLAAIADPIDPRNSPHMQELTNQLALHHTEWVPFSGNLKDDLARLDGLLERIELDTVVIVAPAHLNFHYLEWAISQGLDIICDKPPVAQMHQFGTPNAAHRLWEKFNYLCDLVNKSRHRSYQRPCQIYIHLRRRLEDPYIQIYKGLQEVYDQTQQGLSYLQIHLNNGCYRFNDEYNLPGAHGYTHGVGTLTHTGYHLIDFAAYCFSVAPPVATYIESQLISSTLVKDTNGLNTDFNYGRLLGRSSAENSEQINSHGQGEVEINLDFAFKNALSLHPICEFQLSLQSRGCTRRTTPYYPETCTHDEGRVSDTVFILQQGPLQSFHLLLSEDSDNVGDLRLVRRLNPKVAELIEEPTRSVYDLTLDNEKSPEFPQKLVRICLDAFMNKVPKEELTTLSLQAQLPTIELYVLAIGAAFGKCTSWWERSHSSSRASLFSCGPRAEMGYPLAQKMQL